MEVAETERGVAGMTMEEAETVPERGVGRGDDDGGGGDRTSGRGDDDGGGGDSERGRRDAAGDGGACNWVLWEVAETAAAPLLPRNGLLGLLQH